MRPTEPDSSVHASVGREERDVRVSFIVGFGFWLTVGCVAAALAMWGLFRLFAAESRAEQPSLSPALAASLKRTPAEPRLEPLPLEPRRALRAAEDARLSSYGWVDRGDGIARIPIESAMSRIVQTGVPGGRPFPTPFPQPAPPPAKSGRR